MTAANLMDPKCEFEFAGSTAIGRCQNGMDVGRERAKGSCSAAKFVGHGVIHGALLLRPCGHRWVRKGHEVTFRYLSAHFAKV
jgi:hypothetical protein